METWMWAIVVVAVAGAAIRYVFFLPGRYFARWLWRHMPEGRLKRVLLRKVATDDHYPTWPKLPPGP